MGTLKTDFKDDILSDSNISRKYQMTQNADGTVSFRDATDYSQLGTVYGAKEVNEERETINGIIDKTLSSLDQVEGTTEKGFYVDALAVKELTKDYVIEQGSSKGWHYRKWNSGYIEMQYKNLKTFAVNKPAGVVFTSNDVRVDYPFTILETYSGTVECGDPFCWANMHNLSGTHCSVRIYRGSSYGNISNYITLNITGRWK